MSDKPEALRLADALRGGTYLLSQERTATEAELRRLHAECERLRADAERWQWVRTRALWFQGRPITWSIDMPEPDVSAARLGPGTVAAELDAAIDAARKA